jgi:predicted thioesterase
MRTHVCTEPFRVAFLEDCGIHVMQHYLVRAETQPVPHAAVPHAAVPHVAVPLNLK